MHYKIANVTMQKQTGNFRETSRTKRPSNIKLATVH